MFGIWVEIKKTYKLSVIIIALLSAISTTGTLFSFMWGIMPVTALFCFLIGFSMIPIMAVGFELGVEVTYPIGESMSTGFLMSGGQLVGVLYVSSLPFHSHILLKHKHHSLTLS